MTSVRILAAAFLLAAVACGGNEGFDRDVEKYLTISQGIYGQTTYVDDVGSDLEPRYLPDFAVSVYVVPAGDALGEPVATATSDAHGFYELTLDPGDYVVCTAFLRCVTAAVPAATLRLDYEMSVGPGWSSGTPWPAP